MNNPIKIHTVNFASSHPKGDIATSKVNSMITKIANNGNLHLKGIKGGLRLNHRFPQ